MRSLTQKKHFKPAAASLRIFQNWQVLPPQSLLQKMQIAGPARLAQNARFAI
jgi:hypothetical protein